MKKYLIVWSLVLFVFAGVAVAKYGNFGITEKGDENLVATTTLPVACIEEAMQCSDGSLVTRSGPNCDFEKCPTAPVINPVACTMEAKQCPDGSYVGRTGPKCEFTACPVIMSSVPIGWKEVGHNGFGFSLFYPENYIYTSGTKYRYENGNEWYRVKIEDPTKQASILFEINPDGYGPIFYDKIWTVIKNGEGLVVSKEEILPQDKNNNDGLMIISVKRVSSNYSWTIQYPQDKSFFEDIFRKILESFRVPEII